jgi:hypothetical protein
MQLPSTALHALICKGATQDTPADDIKLCTQAHTLKLIKSDKNQKVCKEVEIKGSKVSKEREDGKDDSRMKIQRTGWKRKQDEGRGKH